MRECEKKKKGEKEHHLHANTATTGGIYYLASVLDTKLCWRSLDKRTRIKRVCVSFLLAYLHSRLQLETEKV